MRTDQIVKLLVGVVFVVFGASLMGINIKKKLNKTKDDRNAFKQYGLSVITILLGILLVYKAIYS